MHVEKLFSNWNFRIGSATLKDVIARRYLRLKALAWLHLFALHFCFSIFYKILDSLATFLLVPVSSFQYWLYFFCINSHFSILFLLPMQYLCSIQTLTKSLYSFLISSQLFYNNNPDGNFASGSLNERTTYVHSLNIRQIRGNEPVDCQQVNE